MILDFVFSFFSHDIGIDLGTANTFVWVRGKGIIIREPSVIARHKKTKKILSMGESAKKMIGKTPAMIEMVKPLADGVIADYDATSAMLKKYVSQAHQSGGLLPKIPRPKVVIGIPSGVTEVERRAVQDAALSAGARKAYLIEEPMAAAIGVGLPVLSPEGSLIIDIGGGTTEIAVISLGGIVIERCLRVAGDEMDEAIINYMRLKYSLLIGQNTAEEIKIQIGSAYPRKRLREMIVRGRDLGTGLPKSLKISSNEIQEAISPVVRQILDKLSEVIEEMPPELVNDVVSKGITLCGGGAQLYGLDKLVAEETKMPVWVSDDPASAVVKGCGKVLEDEALLKRVRIVGGLK
ncbi:MAG: rod shape-determining protein [Patescibacteria group bacterium]|nr:rod shape-determining protein [Patescibacteria group bacterium]